ncbi:MAG: thiol-disulfide oxidoreductase DCC family protein [Bacteroidetes bacterium]|jgi:predicted DCC family thiol-disulfide oxidoreductase YuxK|nr:thiol-disulfide oxidoreductase DCC family protein [Bacteroidota bacterium]MDF1868545.1 thiol-disulfide oxidoreductase DCC family protein [Saprospiraceae bacterium]
MKNALDYPNPVLLFDGVCNLCNSSVQRIIQIDKDEKIKFASLQSELGQSFLKKFNLPTSNYKTMVLVEGEKYFIQSDAVLETLLKVGGFWSIFYVFKIIPKPIRNYFYSVVSKNRYKWWGRQESCMLPTPALKNRFL